MPSPSFPKGIDITQETQVPPGQCIVFGDNSGNSLDSRYWGFLPINSITAAYWFHIVTNPDRSTEAKRPK